MDNKQIIEALQVQPLSEADKTQRHILGRLYGPIATCTESTRNGRKYNRTLWEKALKDEIFQEKVGTKGLFLELGHPTDREETDMTKICAVIPEMPKIINNDLYAYVDILDTANGRILKTLCDYGFQPGISSRGSGDIMPNDEVDPETFFLETWDIVQLPAVKKARLNVCESLDTKKANLKKALTESFEAATDEEKEIMKETLDNLDIELDEASGLPAGMTLDDIPDGQDPQSLLEADESATEEAPVEDAEPTEETPEESNDEEPQAEDSEEEEVETVTLADFMEQFKDFKDETEVELKPVTIEGKEYDVELTVDGDENKIILGVECIPVEGNAEDIEALPAEENPVVGVQIADAVGVGPELVIADAAAVDDGTDEVMESLKDLIRQKSLLENEIKALKKAQTVGNAEVSALKEELEQYKSGFVRVSELAGQATKAKKEVANLSEQLTQKTAQVKELELKVAEKTKLTEGINANNQQVKTLKEQLNKVTIEAATKNKTLTEQLAQSNKKLALKEEQAKQYRNKFAAVLTRYIESKAQMLGVKPTDITSKLNESYTLDDIDAVCDNLMSSTFNNVGRLPINTKKAKAIIKESAQPKSVYNDPDAGYEIDDMLLKLAGLKK